MKRNTKVSQIKPPGEKNSKINHLKTNMYIKKKKKKGIKHILCHLSLISIIVQLVSMRIQCFSVSPIKQANPMTQISICESERSFITWTYHLRATLPQSKMLWLTFQLFVTTELNVQVQLIKVLVGN